MTVSENDKTAIADFIRMQKEHGHDRRILGAEVQTIETRLASPSPNRPELHESLRTVRNLLEGCAGNSIGSGLLFEVAKLLR